MNRKPIDWWTIVHVGAGVAAAKVGVSRPAWVFTMAGYEIAEQAIERAKPDAFGGSGPESLTNALADIAVGWASYEVVRYFDG